MQYSEKIHLFQSLKADTESKSDVSGTWCGAIDPSGQYVIVRQVVSSGPKRGELQKVNRERGSKCFGYQPG